MHIIGSEQTYEQSQAEQEEQRHKRGKARGTPPGYTIHVKNKVLRIYTCYIYTLIHTKIYKRAPMVIQKYSQYTNRGLKKHGVLQI